MTNDASALYKALLDNVRSKLQSQKLTQAEIGHALGIKQSAISYLLSGRTKLTLEQFFALSNLVGEKSYKLISDAEAGLSETRPIPPQMEVAMQKSPMHFLMYITACKPVIPEDFVSQHFNLQEITSALEDLRRAGLLEKREGSYVQIEPNVTFIHPTQAGIRKNFELLRELHRICQQVWMKNYNDKAYRSIRFNHFALAYLTNAQHREILELFWRAFERLRTFNKENAAIQYSNDKFQIWNVHMMLMTPFQG